MNRRFHRVALELTALLACGTAHAQTAVDGPYYATQSWEQTLPAASRFVVLSNFAGNAVLDRETGLVWWRSPDASPGDHLSAQRACVESTVGGRRGWRLPTAGERGSPFDPAATTPPFLPAGHPFTGFDPRSGRSGAPRPCPTSPRACSTWSSAHRRAPRGLSCRLFRPGQQDLRNALRPRCADDAGDRIGRPGGGRFHAQRTPADRSAAPHAFGNVTPIWPWYLPPRSL